MITFDDIRTHGFHGDDPHPTVEFSMAEPTVVEIQIREPGGRVSACVQVATVALLAGLNAIIVNDVAMFSEDAKFQKLHAKVCKECTRANE